MAAGLLALGLRSGPASAEQPSIVDRERIVSVEMARGHARLVVRRTFHNPASKALPAWATILANDGETVTGLRVLAARGWIDGAPHEAGKARDLYRAVSGRPPAGPAVLLSWHQEHRLALDVASIEPGGDVAIEYTVTTSTHYTGGRDMFGATVEGGALAIKAASPGDAVYADGRPVGARGLVQPWGSSVELSLVRGDARPLGGALAAVPLGDGLTLVRARVEVGADLGAAPRGARVVVLLDTSRSLSDDEVRAEAAAASAYLSHMPGAQVETLLFDRRVRAVHGGFVPAAKAIAALDHLVPTRRNGTAIDEALARAAALFAGVEPRVPRRIVILTDGFTRRALDRRALRRLSQSTGALVHVGVFEGTGTARLERDDVHPLAEIARATGGLAWHAAGDADPEAAAAMREAYEAWAHPVQIDHLRAIAPFADVALAVPGEIRRGEGWSDLRIVHRPIGWLKIAGELWSRPISTVLVPDPDEARVAAALAIGSTVGKGLDDAVVQRLATLGHAVSPVTSFVVEAPGVRAATERPGAYFDHGRPCGPDHVVPRPGPHLPAPRPTPDFDAALRSALAPGWAACGGNGRAATVTIEVTHNEVVDVTAAQASGPDGASRARCLSEAAWEIALPDDFLGQVRSFDVAL